MGQIITFYSYKGGTGRTMALANISVLLNQWGYKVLIVDWDLEAPGLEYYFIQQFEDFDKIRQHNGLVDLLTDAANNPDINTDKNNHLDWSELIVNINIPNSRNPISLIKAGKRDDNYFKKVKNLDFKTFYSDKNGGEFIESLRNEWKQNFDFILIDSRTGITDIAGICTIYLPDILVLLFTATRQAFSGILNVAEKASLAQQNLHIERLNLVSIPIPSKFDQKEEFKEGQKWLDYFAESLNDVYENWLPMSVEPRDMLELTKLPYMPYFSFGEKLPVLEHGTIDPGGLGFAYTNLAALIANNLEYVKLLFENRDKFVDIAYNIHIFNKPFVLVAYSSKDKKWRDLLASRMDVLDTHGKIKWYDDSYDDSEEKWAQRVENDLNFACTTIMILTPNFLDSNFLSNNKFLNLLKKRQKERMQVIPLFAELCMTGRNKLLSTFKTIPEKPISGKSSKSEFINNIFLDNLTVDVSKNLSKIAMSKFNKLNISLSENSIFLKLPTTKAKIFRRDQELAIIDDAWSDSNVNILNIISDNGIGKTSLINQWLNKIKSNNYSDAKFVYAWSFYKNKEKNQVDEFLNHALDWLGDYYSDGTSKEKGKRLAKLVSKVQALIILDSLDALQISSGKNKGKFKSSDMEALLNELSHSNAGLCITTSCITPEIFREDLKSSVKNLMLKNQSPDLPVSNILIVDDSEKPRNYMQRHLKKNPSWNITCASSEAQAIEMIENKKFDVVVSDMFMENKDSGLKVFDFAKKIDNSIEVIIITAHSELKEAFNSMPIGSFNFIIIDKNEKDPYKLLYKSVEQAIDKRIGQ